jgi:phage tail-like protein
MGLADTFDSAGSHRFKFKIEGGEPSAIKQVGGLTMKYDVIQTKSIGISGQPEYQVWAGNKQYVGSMSVIRFLTDSVTWYEWFAQTAKNLKDARLDAWLTLYDPRTEDHIPLRTYLFKQCMPSEYKIGDMTAHNAQAVDETLTFHYTNMTVEKG